MAQGRRWWVGALVIAAARAAPGQPAAPAAQAPPPRYPFAVQLRLSPETLRSRFIHDTPGMITAPPNASCTVAVGEQTRDAFASVVRRMFQPEAQEVLELAVSIEETAFELEPRGWSTVVAHAIVLRSPTGEIGRWTVRAREPIAGLGEAAIPAAFERASRQAAEEFELTFGDPPPMAQWLVERGIEPGAYARAVAPSRPRRGPEPEPEAPPRAQYVAFLDAGLGGGGFSDTNNTLIKPSGRVPPYFASGGDNGGSMLVPALRMGMSSSWALVQLALGTWGGIWSGKAPASVMIAGLDAGPLLRLGQRLELALGAGAHLVLTDSAVGDSSYSQIVPTAFATVRFSSAFRGGWLRYGVEARHYFDSEREMVYADDASHRSWRAFAIGNSLTLFVGYELPIDPRR